MPTWPIWRVAPASSFTAAVSVLPLLPIIALFVAPSIMPMPVPMRALFRAFKRLQFSCNFFTFLVHEILFHRVIIIVVTDQTIQFLFSLSLRPADLPRLFRIGIFVILVAGFLLGTFEADGELLIFLFLAVLFLVSCVVDAEDASQHCCAADIVHGQVTAPLVFIL
jgi:hypothetical protein